MTVPPLWHFTSQQAARQIDRDGHLFPGNVVLARRGIDPLSEGGRYVWLTSEPYPTARLLGFNDRTTHLAVRYRVTDPEVAAWWPVRRREHSRGWLAVLEGHALPTLWWVATEPVRVERDRTYDDPTGLWT